GQPFRDLVQAIVLVAGEPSNAAPPNPNVHQYDRDGFREILQAVYQLSAHNQDEAPKVEDTLDDVVKDGLENTTTAFVIMDANQKVVYHNGHAPIRKNVEDEDVLELIFPDEDTLEEWLNKASRNKLKAEHTWTRVSNKLPGEQDRHLYDVVVSYHKNSVAETVITLFDRTNIYMPEEDDLDFISFAAHELRGPITVIRGYLDVLQDELEPVLERDQAELMQRLIVTSNRLTSYVNNILNASRYDRRHLKLHMTEETIRHIYDGIIDDMQLRAGTQNRLLVADIPDDLPTVAADAAAVGEVMSNLIDNAIKYSNEGGLVHVKARPAAGFVEISVIDRGIGMPTSVLPNLFHKFYRSHRSRETVAGTGIGLYICKAIVSSCGGTITARSVENEGSTFSFTLPIYDTVADKLKASDNSNTSLIEHGSGWIRNHSLYRG
ncbi:MAG: putative Histidine kinase, partial [Candidatus Saccharibacteria bacterium]|nr:putative Histidine kinase [Candidatus Saccharibacteria bacterium]